ncbi:MULTISPECIES: ETX/MTX2 family pore-forming toxin [Bacillus cereus group]|uniref:ETX/MTX2 family pore-forming toxin n=1 Tax=Bacillus cereus group TaxID=86661 RepID=UPI001559FB43|nr:MULTISPECIES: ETX/MTX2 family pore-forming toxin [Bacillus cereus group]MBG9832379.1 hypothetical protein [Bacillus wiedmannii]UOB98891.1 pesticidal crystal protein Cry38Aa2 [Bacillus wiedmannii]
MSILNLQDLSQKYMTAVLNKINPKKVDTFHFEEPIVLSESSTPTRSEIDAPLNVMFHASQDLDNRRGTSDLKQTVSFSQTQINTVETKTTDGVKTTKEHTFSGTLELKIKYAMFELGGVSGTYQYKKSTENDISSEKSKSKSDSQTWSISSEYTVKPGVKETLDFYIVGIKTEVPLNIFAEFQGTKTIDNISNVMAYQEFISQDNEHIRACMKASKLANPDHLSGYTAPKELKANTSKGSVEFRGTAIAKINTGVKCLVVVNGKNSITGKTYSYIHPKTMLADGTIEYLESEIDLLESEIDLLTTSSILV